MSMSCSLSTRKYPSRQGLAWKNTSNTKELSTCYVWLLCKYKFFSFLQYVQNLKHSVTGRFNP